MHCEHNDLRIPSRHIGLDSECCCSSNEDVEDENSEVCRSEREHKEEDRRTTEEFHFFKLHHPVGKKQDGFPEATERAYMEQRRPLWLPKFGLDMAYFKFASYFSEIISKEQFIRQALIDSLYNPRFGEYKFCKASVLKKGFVSEYLQGIHSTQFSPNGEFLALGFGNGSIKIYDFKIGHFDALFLKGLPRKITAIRFLAGDDTTFFASSLTGRVFMGKNDKGSLPDNQWTCYSYLKEFGNEINALDSLKYKNCIFTAGKDTAIRLYDVERKKLLQLLTNKENAVGLMESVRRGPLDIPEDGHYKRICALTVDKNSDHVLYTGGWDNVVKVWDVRVGNYPVKTIYGPHISGDALDTMDNHLLTGQWTCNESLQLWDISTGKLITNISPRNRPIWSTGEFINCAKFIHGSCKSSINFPGAIGDLIIAGGSGTKALEIISIKENAVLHFSEEANAVVAADNFEHLIVYGGASNVYSIMSFFPYVGSVSLNDELPKESASVLEKVVKTEQQNIVRVDEELVKQVHELENINGYKVHDYTPSEYFISCMIDESKIRRGIGVPPVPKTLIEQKLQRYIDKIASKDEGYSCSESSDQDNMKIAVSSEKCDSEENTGIEKSQAAYIFKNKYN